MMLRNAYRPAHRLSIMVLVHGFATVLICGMMLPLPLSAQTSSEAQTDVPVLAYYYIWFTPSSWNRAKLDIPLLGPYASDDPEVMRQHVQWAKASGIDGFIVSWKHTTTLSKRLAQLVDIAEEEDFKLVIIYQGLDFYRHPLPVERIYSDLTYFADTYESSPVFDLFGKPAIIWSGTWKFDRTELEFVTGQHRSRLLILASEKQPQDYERIADLVDGNAYYWSSVDPSTFPDYAGKLGRMSEAVHRYDGLWIAPAAPGFDARHLGGEREVPRDNGQVLEAQVMTALDSNPDALGLISWNEFSENSHIEPSCLYGDDYLAFTAGLLGGQATSVDLLCDAAALATAQAGADPATPAPPATPVGNITPAASFDWDSSAPEGASSRGSRIGTLALLGVFAGLMAFSVFKVTRRALREENSSHRASGRSRSFPTEGEAT